MTYSLNLILAVMPDVGQNAVTVYGLYYKIQQLIIFAAFGVRDAITPVVAFNYGLRSRARVQQGIRWGLGYTAGLMLLGCCLLYTSFPSDQQTGKPGSVLPWWKSFR